MPMYCGIDLHSTNSYVSVIDQEDKIVFERRLSNDLKKILGWLEPHRAELESVAVESTFNWYWLVDGLMDHGYDVRLVNTSAVRQYEGLKSTDDRHDARWLAHLLRLGILPEGFIYPRGLREARDLLRRRTKLVQQRVANLLTLQSMIARDRGVRMSCQEIRRLSPQELNSLLDNPLLEAGAGALLRVVSQLQEEASLLLQTVKKGLLQDDSLQRLMAIPGIGETLALTILLETGPIERFPTVGNYASYCRCVRTQRLSNQKRKGEGNKRNGNPYLSWAYSEAAVFARRFQPLAQRFYERKRRKTHQIVALRSLAHKLCRACYFVLRDEVPYQPQLLFR